MQSVPSAHFPIYRPRRLRQRELLRVLVQESHLRAEQLILPLFVVEGEDRKVPVKSMPGVFQLSIDNLIKEVRSAISMGVKSILLFGIPVSKDDRGSEAYSSEGITQKAIRALRKEFKNLIIITDVCLCEYTNHGHCGMLKKNDRNEVIVDNDSTLKLLAQTALSHIQAGADIVAPSDMMDGRVRAIRTKLDENGYQNAVIMSYAAKFASSFYGPFRDAADSAPQFGDRRAYQMNPANGDEALREVQMDIEEGADIVMVKPGLPYLDILYRVKETFKYPTAAYMVSGEYAMIKAAGLNGWIDEERVMYESHLSMVRAGADLIITYAAKELCQMLIS